MTLDELLLGTSMTTQDVANAMLLAPSGVAAAGSIVSLLTATRTQPQHACIRLVHGTYYLTSFCDGVQQLVVATSKDGIVWENLDATALEAGAVRDPELIQLPDMTWVVIHTQGIGPQATIPVYTGSSLSGLTLLTTITTGLDEANWAPHLYLDVDTQLLHIFVGNATTAVYELHASLADLTTWSSPVKVLDGYYDPWVSKIGDTYYLFNTLAYNGLWVATSSSLTGPYTNNTLLYATTSGADDYEGPCLVYDSAIGYRLYFAVAGGDCGGMYVSLLLHNGVFSFNGTPKKYYVSTATTSLESLIEQLGSPTQEGSPSMLAADQDVNVTKIKDVDADTAISARVDASTLAGKFAGITLIAKWLRGLFRKDTMDPTAKTEVNLVDGTFDESTGSLEAAAESIAALGTPMQAGEPLSLPATAPAGWINAEAIDDDALLAIAHSILGLAGAIDGKTPQQALQIIAAAIAGMNTGAGSGNETYRGLDKLTTRLTVTVDGTGNRTATTYN